MNRPSELPTAELSQTKSPPKRLGPALFLGAATWIAPFVALNTVLIPALLSEIAPSQKVALLAVLSAAGAIVGLFANILFGALSDRTRSRFGKRAPWMIVGSVGSAAAALIIASAQTGTTVLIGWVLFQVFLGGLVAPMVTVIPDRVPDERRGSFSSVYGVAMMVGGAIGGILGSRFLENPRQGIIIMAVVVLCSGPLFALLAPDTSNKDVERSNFDVKEVLSSFKMPSIKNSDFYKALFGKLFFVIGTYAVTGYQLYILTDYMGASTETAANIIALYSIIHLLLGAVFGAVTGPLSDKVKQRKIFVIGAAVLIAAGTIIPLIVAQPWTLLLFAVFGGIGGGTFNAVDQAVNYAVLPDGETAAKDLGILNMANNGGQVLGPLLASVLITLFASYAVVFAASAVSLILSGVTIKAIKSVK